MADSDTRLRCPWCTTRVTTEAAICHGCGAIRARASLSMMQLFFLYPLAAFALMLAGLGGLGLSVIPAAAVFAVAWTLFSVIHIVMRLRPRWMQVEPLLLEDEKDDEHLAHQAPVAFAPWWAGAATVAAGLALIWAIAPRSGAEPANAAVSLALAPATTMASAPINVAVVAPPREALPPKPSSPLAQTAMPEPPKVATAVIDITKAETAKVEAMKAETAKAEAAKMQTAAAAPATSPSATVQTATADAAKTEAPKTEPAGDTQILAAQRLLAELGYLSGSPDGKMSAGMRAAVKEFRADMSLKGEAIDARLVADLQSVMSARQQAEARRSVRAEAKRSEPKRAETKPAAPRQFEPRQAETRQADARPMQQAEMTAMQVSAPSPSSGGISPPPLSVLNGLTAARAAAQGHDQAPVRLAPIRLH